MYFLAAIIYNNNNKYKRRRYLVPILLLYFNFIMLLDVSIDFELTQRLLHILFYYTILYYILTGEFRVRRTEY